MCTNPRTITRKASTVMPFLPGTNIAVSSLPRHLQLAVGYSTSRCTVGCGKCVECLRLRQSQLACLVASEACKRGSLEFLTLTYDDENLPFSFRVHNIVEDTGEIVSSSSYQLLDRDAEILAVVREKFKKKNKSRRSVRVHSDGFSIEGHRWAYEFTPSLNRRDVRLWLKNCRVKYKREFGEALPEFTYVLVGEYGPNTCRPHYHCVFMGLQRKHTLWLSAQWQKGFTNLKSVKAVNDDGTNGFVLAARYVGKYISKGCFECDAVLDGYAEKPRFCHSTHMGELPQDIVNYYRCYDVVGHYDIQTAKKPNGEFLSEIDLQKLCNVVRQRNFINVMGQKFPLPMSIIKQIWYVSNFDYFTRSRAPLASVVRSAISASSRIDDIDDYLRSLRQRQVNEAAIPSLLAEFCSLQDSRGKIKELRDAEAFRRDLAKSIF